MKKYALMMAIALTLASAHSAWSQTAGQAGPGGDAMEGNGGPPPPPPGAEGGAPGGGPGNGQNFQQRKADILQHLNQHLAEMQQRIACVQAANDHEALRACMPPRGQGPGGR